MKNLKPLDLANAYEVTFQLPIDKVRYVRRLLRENGGQYYRVSFTKKDGSTRDMICGKVIKSTIKGTGSPLSPDSTVVRVSESFVGNRSYDMERVEAMKIDGQVYKFTQVS